MFGWQFGRHEGTTSDDLVIGCGPLRICFAGDKFPIETGSYDEHEFIVPSTMPHKPGRAVTLKAAREVEAGEGSAERVSLKA